LGVGTGKGVDRIDHLLMAGAAGRLDIVPKDNIEGLVRIAMTAETVFQIEMRLPFMADATLGNHRPCLHSRRMWTAVAVQAGNVGLMLRSGLFDLTDDLGMAFGTVLIDQVRCHDLVCREQAGEAHPAEYGRYDHNCPLLHRSYPLQIGENIDKPDRLCTAGLVWR
jgi:hypothetical protein